MKNCLIAVAVFLTPSAFANSEPPGKEKTPQPITFTKVYEIKIADLDEFVVKTDKMLVNNFAVSESATVVAKGMVTLRASGKKEKPKVPRS